MTPKETASALNWRAWLRSRAPSPIQGHDVSPILEAMDAELMELRAAARAVVDIYEGLGSTSDVFDAIIALRAALESPE